MKKIIIISMVILVIVSCGKSNESNSIDKNNLKDTAVNTQEDNKKYNVTFIELGSDRCAPCRMMKPIIKSIKKEYNGRVKVINYNVDTARDKAREYKIRVIPTQIFLDKNGNEYYRHEGFFPKDKLVKVIEKQL